MLLILYAVFSPRPTPSDAPNASYAQLSNEHRLIGKLHVGKESECPPYRLERLSKDADNNVAKSRKHGLHRTRYTPPCRTKLGAGAEQPAKELNIRSNTKYTGNYLHKTAGGIAPQVHACLPLACTRLG